MNRDFISLERLRYLLHYNEETGEFIWRVTRNADARKGDIAGTVNAKGYVMIGADGRLYQAHRLAWFYVTGEWPSDQIDHKNNLTADNSFENLRQASRTDNNRNRRFKKNKTGFKGVSLHGTSKKWTANIWKDGKQQYLGLFDTPEQAHKAYRAAAVEMHGEFANF